LQDFAEDFPRSGNILCAPKTCVFRPIEVFT
jgi:hypothetical protein